MGQKKFPITEQIYVRTPMIESIPLRKYSADRKVFLKLENCQPSGSFKLRGISKLCRYAKSQGFTELVCASGGNAGLATAFTAMQLEMSACIVVQRGTSAEICNTIKSYGATIEVCGDSFEEAKNQAYRIIADSSRSFLVHPFDDPILWEGHSTIVDEIATDFGSETPSIIVTCCGGGGLISGIVQGVRRYNWQDSTKILSMETVGTHSFNACVKAGGVKARLDKITSIVTCLGATEVCDQIVNDFNESRPPILSRLITDAEAIDACVQFANDHRMVVGPACGTAMAALYRGFVKRILNNDEEEHEAIYDKVNNLVYNQNSDGPIVAIVCGGCEISFDTMNDLKKEFNC
ncbi:hypothetical protein RDWZM_000096 [Blomia tropicalis]|uniref:L-serine ammonia-lyase n=1 Tax=Blomia tropicalis TaxID=40697 RepID=A0A9Q0M8Y7_BLOTA|nr:hypothetical protein RDWZM_000096 [Blomia tropicalis]